MLKSKIHRATLTGADLHYEGSIAIDSKLLEAADILPNEQVQVLNINTGSRIITYAIAAEAGSGTVMLNGPAARTGCIGDPVIVLTYTNVAECDISNHSPKLVFVDSQNRLKQ